jgi:hypothetical protein
MHLKETNRNNNLLCCLKSFLFFIIFRFIQDEKIYDQI